LPPKSLSNSGQRGLTGRLRSKADQEQDQDQERLASHRGYLSGTFDFSVDRTAAFAGKPAPTG
ncbi:hypothetical protein, partial [Pseudomonas carnis]